MVDVNRDAYDASISELLKRAQITLQRSRAATLRMKQELEAFHAYLEEARSYLSTCCDGLGNKSNGDGAPIPKRVPVADGTDGEFNRQTVFAFGGLRDASVK